MKSSMNRPLLAVVLLMMSASVFAATATFVNKEVARNGQMQYFYKYFCSSGAEGMITVTASDDNAAKKLADTKAKVVCEE